MADLTNGNAAAGAIAGGSTEYLAKAILKASKGDKAQAQWIAMIVGAAMSKATGGNPQLGAFIAMNAIRNNDFGYTIEELQEEIENSNYGEQICAIRGIEPTPENIAEIENEFLSNVLKLPKSTIHGFMINGNIGLTKWLGVGTGAIIDTYGNVYHAEDIGVSKGLSAPLSGEVCALTIIPLDDTVDLTDRKVIQRILSGESFNITVYAGVGGGLSIPASGDYEGKVVILKRGFGVPQIGISVGKTELIETMIKRRLEGPQIED